MAASKITVNRGTSYAITVNYKEDGLPANITGSTILFTVKSVEYDSDDLDASAIIQKNVTSHTNPTGGVSTISLVPADTRDVDPGKYFYSIKIDKNSDDQTVYELAEGQFVLDGDPTNRIA